VISPITPCRPNVAPTVKKSVLGKPADGGPPCAAGPSPKIRPHRPGAMNGRPLASRQVIKHRLAEMARQIDVARTYVRHTALRVASGEQLVTEVAMAKNTAVAACDHVVDQAVQLHGGFGYLRDAEVERHYRDARILGIGGGTTEIMNEIIAKRLGV